MGRPYWRAQLGRRPPPSTFDARRDLPRAGGACSGYHARLRLHSAQQPDIACSVRGTTMAQSADHL
eukprot:3816233-Prymnesium_polylepis.1